MFTPRPGVLHQCPWSQNENKALPERVIGMLVPALFGTMFQPCIYAPSQQFRAALSRLQLFFYPKDTQIFSGCVTVHDTIFAKQTVRAKLLSLHLCSELFLPQNVVLWTHILPASAFSASNGITTSSSRGCPQRVPVPFAALRVTSEVEYKIDVSKMPIFQPSSFLCLYCPKRPWELPVFR